MTENDFTYNAANQIGQIAELAQTKNFAYDNVDRLTGMTNGTANESYAFDSVGNRTSSHQSASYTHQPFNKLTATATATFSYDANGNMLSKSDTTGYWVYGWDHENRMISARKQNRTVRYEYDALGRRVSRQGKSAGSTGYTKYVYDGLDVVMDIDGSTVTKYQNGPGIDNKLSLKTGSDVKYFLQDHLGSTIGLTDQTGAITAPQSYDSFGHGTNTNFPTRYQFTGREFDSFTGLQFSRARHYDPKIGRFISEDPIGFSGGDINLYGYAWNQPIGYKDPLGLNAAAAYWPYVAAGGAGIGAIVPPLGLAIAGGALIYGAWDAGETIARHPSNPFSRPWVSPDVIRPSAPPITACYPKPKPIPWTIPYERSIPIPMPTPDREGCAEEISACVQMCEKAGSDEDYQGRFPGRRSSGGRGIWGGSRRACLEGCITDRCKKGFKF